MTGAMKEMKQLHEMRTGPDIASHSPAPSSLIFTKDKKNAIIEGQS